MWPGLGSKAGLILDGGLRNQLTATGRVLGLVPPPAGLPSRQGQTAPWDVPSATSAGCTANKQGICAPWDVPAATAIITASPSSAKPGLIAPWDAHAGTVTTCGSSAGGWYRLLSTCSLPMRGTQLALLSLRAGGGSGPASASSMVATAADVGSAMPCLRTLRLEGPEERDGLGERAGSMLRPEGVVFADFPASVEQVDYVGAELPRVYYSSEWWQCVVSGGVRGGRKWFW